MNMALDLTLLEMTPSAGSACWRLYGWTEPAVTFGYSQRWRDVQGALHPFRGQAIRRVTGGGIVDHRHDLTYALGLGAAHPFFRHKATDLYREFHQCVAAVLTDSGYPAALEPCPGPCPGQPGTLASLCFRSAEPYDVVDPASGHKLAGAAMKRAQAGLLIQGSLDCRSLPGLSRDSVEASLGQRLADWLGLPGRVLIEDLPESTLSRETARFASDTWNRLR